jgi:EpsI family protein
MTARVLILFALLVSAAAYIAKATKAEQIPIRQRLVAFPRQIGDWQGHEAADIEDSVLAVLGVDDYLNRIYSDSKRRNISLYVGYYQSQRQGDTIHSPMNCLPGAGWNPVERGRITIPVTRGWALPSSPDSGPPQAIEVSRIVIQKGLDKQIVLYWYQSHGRIIASEYWAKIYTVIDAIRMNRTDAALVRLISPITVPDDQAEESAERGVDGFFFWSR